MKCKRLFNFLVLAVCALAGVAAVQWYSQQPAVTTYENSDVLVVERAVPHGLKSTTLTNLRTYMQTGTLLSANGSVDRTNLADNTKVIFNPDQFGTNGSGPFNVFIRSNVFLTNPVVASGFISGNGSGLTNVHMTNLVDDAGTPLFSQSGDELTFSWFGGQETIVFGASGDSITLAPNITINTNLTVNSIAKIYGAQTNFSGAYSLASTTNSPSTLEFATAGWVRSLLGSGAHFYNSTNLAPGWLPTKGDAQPFLYVPDIPAPAVRAYASAYLTNNGYLGGIAITNLTQFEGPFVVATYLGFAGGIATPTITIKPEIYYSYDNGTNLLGDWDTQAQSITHGQTNLYSWVIAVPSTVSTGGTFTVYRLFKIVSASFGGSPTLSVHVGTNTASHISFTEPVVAGGTYSGTFVGGGSGVTNIPLSGIQTNGATSGQVVKFDGTNWAVGADSGGDVGNAVTNNDTRDITLAADLQVEGVISGDGRGISNVLTTPIDAGLAYAVSAFGSNTFWSYPDGVIVAMDFRPSSSLVPLGGTSGNGGSTPVAANGFLRVNAYPTNASGYSVARYSTAGILWSSNFVFDTSFYISGVESTYFDFGLMDSFTNTEDLPDAVRWIGNTNFSANWIASCTYDNTSSYWTSSVAIATGTNRLSIYAASTNAVNFYTNGVWACAITENIPGGQVLNVAARVNSLTDSGATTQQNMYMDWWHSLFQ